MEWVVLDWNKHAIDFYERSGANILKGWYTVQMDEEGIKKYVETTTMKVFKFGGASVKDAEGVKMYCGYCKRAGEQ